MSWQNSGLQQQPRDSATHLESQFRQHFSILQPTTPTPPVQVENIRAIFSFLIATSFQPMYSCRLCLMSMWNFQTFIVLNYWSWLLSNPHLASELLSARPLLSQTTTRIKYFCVFCRLAAAVKLPLQLSAARWQQAVCSEMGGSLIKSNLCDCSFCLIVLLAGMLWRKGSFTSKVACMIILVQVISEADTNLILSHLANSV